MLQMVGSLILIGSMGGLGIMAAGKLNREVEQLRDLEYGLTVLSKEIIYGHTRLAQALKLAARELPGSVGYILRTAGEGIACEEMTPRQAFAKAMDTATDWDTQSARFTLLRLADELGTSNVSEQERFLKLAQEELHAQRQRAAAKATSQGKIYRWGGFLVGGMLALLLI